MVFAVQRAVECGVPDRYRARGQRNEPHAQRGNEQGVQENARRDYAKDWGLKWLRPGARGGLIGAFLVLTLYGGYHFDVIGFEQTPQDNAPGAVQQSGVIPSIASSKAPQSSLSAGLASLVPSTATPVLEPTPTATAEATETPTAELEEQHEEDTSLEAAGASIGAEPTETPEPEPTATPESPTATPSPTPAPPTPTATLAPPTATATSQVAMGVPVTPKAAGATATPSAGTPAAPARTAAPIALNGTLNGKVTPYYDGLAGQPLGCGNGPYDPNDQTTAAVGWDLHESVPCGTKLELCSDKTCITVERKDTCPGCVGTHIDVSRRAFDLLCGPVNDCGVRITRR